VDVPSNRFAWLNGRFVPESEAGFSVFDSGVTGGRMVFETSRTFGGRPFHLEEHLSRLMDSMRMAGITSELDAAAMTAATIETVKVNRAEFEWGEDFIITHNVSGGVPANLARETGLRAGANTSIHLWPLRDWHAERAGWYDSGVRAVITARPDSPATVLDPAMKHRDRLAFHLAENAAQEKDKESWALLADAKGRITEGTSANFMLVSDGILLSPPTAAALPGITRRVILDLARKAGIQFEERQLGSHDVDGAGEAFFCASTFVIMPVASIDGSPLSKAVPGPVTRLLMKDFSDLVGLDFVAQGKHYAGLT
jgi:branched-chain amino acid aminotransferase